MTLKFYFVSQNDHISFFLDFWAKKSGLKYLLTRQNSRTELFVCGSEGALEAFINEAISQIPHSIFLEDSGVEVADDSVFGESDSAKNTAQTSPQTASIDAANTKSGTTKITASDSTKITESDSTKTPAAPLKSPTLPLALFKNITPLALNSGINEQGFATSPEAVGTIIAELNASKSVIYDGYEIAAFSDFSGDFVLPTNLKNIPKIAIAGEPHLIALASFEKPILNLRTNSVFKTAHPDAPQQIPIRAAWDGIIRAVCENLNEAGVKFLSVKTKKRQFRAEVLQNSILNIDHGGILSDFDSDFLEKSSDKNMAHFGLILRDFDLLNRPAIRVFMGAGETDDSIILYKDDREFSYLKINLPATYEELFDKIRALENGEKLLENFAKSRPNAPLPTGQTGQKNSFLGLIKVAGQIIGCDLDAAASDYSGAKGVRIDCKIVDGEFDIARFIASILSFHLAGAGPANIGYGCFESWAGFLGDFADMIEDECGDIILTGRLFERRFLAEMVIKLCGGKARFSQKYGLIP